MRATTIAATLLIAYAAAEMNVPAGFTANGGEVTHKTPNSNLGAFTNSILRRYGSAFSSGYTSGGSSYTSASSYTSGGATEAPTGAPTQAPTGAPTAAPTMAHSVQLTQKITYTITAVQFTGILKDLMIKGYAKSIGCWTASQGYLCTVTAAVARRAIEVTYTSKLPSDIAASVKTKSATVTVASLKTAMDDIKAADAATYGTVTVPTATNVKVATSTTIVSGTVNKVITSVWTLVALCLAVFVIRQ